MKLQEFVKFLEGQMQAGPPLLEALGNADVFYEMQYKEVKIVASVSQHCWVFLMYLCFFHLQKWN